MAVLAAGLGPDAVADIDRNRQSSAMLELGAHVRDALVRVATRGSGRLQRLLSLVLLGDRVSLYLAVLRRVDPLEIAAIAQLKAALGSS
jgi:glucose/mannose-6-phosphate isomerase